MLGSLGEEHPVRHRQLQAHAVLRLANGLIRLMSWLS